MDDEVNDMEQLTAQAERALVEGNISRLISLYQRMEELGVWQVTARIGELYETGYRHKKHIFDRDLDEAVKWYRKAIFESDDPLAHLGLGRIYFQGSDSVKKDLIKARVHLRKAYDNNLAQAGIYLGMMSMFGASVEKNMVEARQFFCSAASNGYPLGYQFLAKIELSAGNFLGAIKAQVKAMGLTIRLKIQDRNHPNLWKMPK
jgi:TPR repeat protein